MPDMERSVAGIRCREVLERLSDYVDGSLAPDEMRQVDAHLAGCDQCERFGGEFGEMVAVLRRELAEAPPVDDGVAARLRERLDRAL